MLTRELTECVVVIAPLRDGRGRGSFSAQVSRLLRVGYKPLGFPHYNKTEAILALTKELNESEQTPIEQ